MSVFLSYASADKKLAEKLKDELGKAGLSVWSDSDLTAGEEWRRRIEEAIRAASDILVLVGPKNGDDPLQQITWQVALESVWQHPSKRLIPILVQGAAPPPFIYSAASASDQWLVRLDDPRKVKDLVREIAGLILGEGTREPELARGERTHKPAPRRDENREPSQVSSPPPITLVVQDADPHSRGERLSEIREYAERLRSSR